MADALAVLDRAVEVGGERAQVTEQAVDRLGVATPPLRIESRDALVGDRHRILARRGLDAVETRVP